MPRKKTAGPKFTGICAEVLDFTEIAYDLQSRGKLDGLTSEQRDAAIFAEIGRRRDAKLVPLFLQLNADDPNVKPDAAEIMAAGMPEFFYRTLATQLAIALGVPGFQTVYSRDSAKGGRPGRPKKYSRPEAAMFLMMVDMLRAKGAATDRAALEFMVQARRPDLERNTRQAKAELNREVRLLANELSKLRSAAKARARGAVH